VVIPGSIVHNTSGLPVAGTALKKKKKLFVVFVCANRTSIESENGGQLLIENGSIYKIITSYSE